MTNNTAFCISEYISNRYKICMEEDLCYLLGSSIDLQLIKREGIYGTNTLLNAVDIRNSYIESTNPAALENFCTCIGAVLRIDHNNDLNDLKWIISDYHNLGKIKTLARLSSSIYENSNETHPLYALVYPVENEPPSYDDIALDNSKLSVSLGNNVRIIVCGKQFKSHWRIENDENFNANRYVVIPPIYSDFEKTLPDLFRNALTRQYFHMTNKGKLVGPKLITTLIEDLKTNSTKENLDNHKYLLLSSAKGDTISGGVDANRAYAAKAFENLHNRRMIEECSIVNALCKASRAWSKTYKFLRYDKVSSTDMLNVYNNIHESELNILVSLKQLIERQWRK